MKDIQKNINEFDEEHQVMRIILIGKDEAIRQIILEEDDALEVKSE